MASTAKEVQSRREEEIAFIKKYRELLAEDGSLSTDAEVELVRGLDSEIGEDFAELFGDEGQFSLFGFNYGVKGIPLSEKLQGAVDTSLPDDLPRIFAGVSNDANFEDQVIGVFNAVGGRATEDQYLRLIEQVRLGRQAESEAFVVDVTAALLTSETGAYEARGLGAEYFDRITQAEAINRQGLGAPGGGITLFGTLAEMAGAFVNDINFATDNLAPQALRDDAKTSLLIETALTVGPVAALKIAKTVNRVEPIDFKRATADTDFEVSLTEGELAARDVKSASKIRSGSINIPSKPIPLTATQIDEITNLNPHGIKAQKILVGDNGKVAIIGRSMGNLKNTSRGGEAGVVDYARQLRSQGYDTELFAGKQIKQEWFDEIEALRIKHGVDILPDEVIHQTTFYKENIKWAQKLRQENYTVIDIGNPNNKPDLGPFYSGELNAIFGNAPPNKIIYLTKINGY